MARIERFEDIEAWKCSREIVNLVYEMSRNDRFARDFALVNQIRRAAISILSNIAEGFERNGDKEFVQFLSIAKGSCGEVRTQLYVALDQEYIDAVSFTKVEDKLVQTSRMLSGLVNYLKQSELKGSKFR